MAGSIVGLLTVASWVSGDASPFNALSAVAHWLGIHIAGPLAHADAWLNAKPRHDGLLAASSIVLLLATLRHAARLANRYQNEKWEAAFDAKRAAAFRRREDAWIFKCDVHFWAVAWIITGLLAQLHETSVVLVFWLVLILSSRGIAEVHAANDEKRLSQQRRAARAAEERSGNVEPGRKAASEGSSDQPTIQMVVGRLVITLLNPDFWFSVRLSLELAVGTLFIACFEVHALVTEPRIKPPTPTS